MQIWKYSLILFLMPFLAFAPQAIAKDSPEYKQVTDEALRAVFADTMMIGEYRTYRDETRTYNYTEFHTTGGATDYVEGKAHEKGVWTIVGHDKICYKYPRSQSLTRTYCFFVYESEKCYYKYSRDNMTLNGPRVWDRWTSRAVRKGSGGSCGLAVG